MWTISFSVSCDLHPLRWSANRCNLHIYGKISLTWHVSESFTFTGRSCTQIRDLSLKSAVFGHMLKKQCQKHTAQKCYLILS